MEDFSFLEKIGMLTKMMLSSPLFLFCSMMGIYVLIYYIITIKKKKNVNKWLFLGIWVVLLIILIISYKKVVFNLFDNLFDTFFRALYFPNLSIYLIILFVTNGFFFYSIFSKNMKSPNKIVNFVNALVIDLLLIPIIDIVQSNNINVYEELTIYSNSNLLVLLELSSGVFTSWILIKLFMSAKEKLKKYDKKEIPKMPEIIFEDI